VVLGDVGTGKTTLSRRLFQVMQDPQVEFHPIFTPFARTDVQFMHLLLEAFQLKVSTHQEFIYISRNYVN
jgi:GTPase SAR1 family protein